MSGAVQRLGPQLQRMIVLREVDARQWKVEAYECLAGRWRFTWLLNPPTTKAVARTYASNLARHTGLPIGEQRLGERIEFVGGILGRAA